MVLQKSATTRLNLNLCIFFSEFVRVGMSRLAQALFFGRTIFWQRHAARVRSTRAAEVLTVPPIVIFSNAKLPIRVTFGRRAGNLQGC